MASKRRTSLNLVLIISALSALVALSACSGGDHQIITSSNTCSFCHSDTKEVVDTAPSSLKFTDVALDVTVKTSADSVSICTPVYTTSSSKPFVPREYRTVRVTGGSAQITLEEGDWIIALDNDSSSKCVLVHASADGTTTEVSL